MFKPSYSSRNKSMPLKEQCHRISMFSFFPWNLLILFVSFYYKLKSKGNKLHLVSITFWISPCLYLFIFIFVYWHCLIFLFFLNFFWLIFSLTKMILCLVFHFILLYRCFYINNLFLMFLLIITQLYYMILFFSVVISKERRRK